MKIKQAKGDRVFSGINYIILILIAISTLFPFLDVVFTSITPTVEIVKNAKQLIAIPKNPTLGHYIYILKGNSPILHAMLVTVLRSVGGTTLSLIVTALTAYPLSKKYLYGRNTIMKFFFFTMIFNGGMIPTFLVVRSLGLIDTFWALILPSMLSIYNMIIIRTFFMSIPEELEEAARIDGCSDFMILIKIIFPLSTPVLASIGLFYAVAHWNAFFDAVLYITNRKLWPLQTLLREILLSTSVSELQLSMLNEATPPSNAIISATIMISTVPIICVYPFLQKYFVKGVMIGSIKG
jgi:putative aldouronate transport system permease protein